MISLAVALALWVVATGVLGMLISLAIRGYLFSRPELDPRIVEVDDYLSITLVDTCVSDGEGDGAERLIFCVDSDETMDDLLYWAKQDPYYNLSERLLVHLDKRGGIPERPGLTDDELHPIYPLLQSTGKLEVSESDLYRESSQDLHGIVVEAVDENGKELLFVSVDSFSFWGDTRVHYDFLFEGRRDASPLLIGFGSFYFDVSGLEDFGYPHYLLWGATISSIPCAVIAFLLFITMTMRGLWRDRRDMQQAETED